MEDLYANLTDLSDDNWTPEETTYLFTLLQSYDLRFIVVADRYAYLVKPSASAGGRKRAMGRRAGRAAEGDEDTDDAVPEIRRRSIEVGGFSFPGLRPADADLDTCRRSKIGIIPSVGD